MCKVSVMVKLKVIDCDDGRKGGEWRGKKGKGGGSHEKFGGNEAYEDGAPKTKPSSGLADPQDRSMSHLIARMAS